MNGFEYDTTVTLIGSYIGSSRSGILTVETGTTSVIRVVAPGDTSELVVRNVEQVDPTIDTLAFDLSFDRDALDVLSVSVASGWKIISQYETSDGWHFSLQRTQSDVVEVGTALLTVKVRTALSRNGTTPIVLQQLIEDSVINCGMTSITVDGKCATPLLRHFMQTGSIFELLSIEPNPASQTVMVALDKRDEAEVAISVSDVLGNPRLTATTSETRTSLDVSRLPSGTYFLRASEAGTVRTRRFVVDR